MITPKYKEKTLELRQYQTLLSVFLNVEKVKILISKL